VSREALWTALLDPTLLARILPGCEPLESAGENSPGATEGSPIRYLAAMTVAVGPVKGRFSGSLALSDLLPPSGYSMKIDGSGPSGFLRGAGAIELAEAGAGTKLTYRVDAQVGGRIASVGQRLVESSAKAIAKQGLEGLERELAARAVAATATASAGDSSAPASVASPPSQAAFAGRFAIGLWRELPPSWRWTAIIVALAALAGLGVLLLG
jgi:hypothetical protein